VLSLLDEAGYGRVDVLGVSFGGGVAQELAHLAPKRVRRLVLAATMPGLGGVPGDPRVLAAMATPRRYHSPDHFRRVAPRIYGGATRHDPDGALLAAQHRFAHPPSVAGYVGQLYAMSGWSSLRYLHRLPQRTLVLAGDDDPIVPLVNGRILARRIPRARLVVVPGGGHLFLLEQAAGMARLVTEFLTDP
jgi:poly(3-hydroxyalkanoate) depolymerase